MSGTKILITLNKPEQFMPGDILICEFQVRPAPEFEVDCVEVSVMWSTEGKGQPDIGVHYFDRKRNLPASTFNSLQKLSTVLPQTPRSYDGRIIKVNWFVRVKVFGTRGETVTRDSEFRLGDGCFFPSVAEEEESDEAPT